MAGSFDRDTLEDVAAIMGRILLVILFLVSGWSKLKAGPASIEDYFANVGVPLPSVAYYVALLVEIPVAALFLLGWQTRWLALVLAAWCVATAMFGHSNIADNNQWIHFMKNLGLAGGFLNAFAYGGGRYSVDGSLRSSSQAVA